MHKEGCEGGAGTCLAMQRFSQRNLSDPAKDLWDRVEGNPDSANEILKRTIVQELRTKCKEIGIEVWFKRQTNAGA